MRRSVRLSAQTALGLVSAGMGIGSYLYNPEKRTYIDVCSGIGALVSGVYVASSILEQYAGGEKSLGDASSLPEKVTEGLTEVTAAAGMGGLLAYGGALSLDYAAGKASIPFIKALGYVTPVLQQLAPFVVKGFKYYGSATSAVSGGILGATVMDAALMAGETLSDQKVPEHVRSLMYTAAAGAGGALMRTPLGSVPADTARFMLSFVVFGALRQSMKNYRSRQAADAEGNADVFENVRFVDVVKNSPWVFIPMSVAQGGKKGVQWGLHGLGAGLDYVFGADKGDEPLDPVREGKSNNRYTTRDVTETPYVPQDYYNQHIHDVDVTLPGDADMPPLEEGSDSEPSSPRTASRQAGHDIWVTIGPNMRSNMQHKAYDPSEVNSVRDKLASFMKNAKEHQFSEEKPYVASDEVRFGSGEFSGKPIIWIRKIIEDKKDFSGFCFIDNNKNYLHSIEEKVTFSRWDEKSAENPDRDEAEVKRVAKVVQDMKERAVFPEGAKTGAYGIGSYFATPKDVRPLVWTEVINPQQNPNSETKLIRMM